MEGLYQIANLRCFLSTLHSHMPTASQTMLVTPPVKQVRHALAAAEEMCEQEEAKAQAASAALAEQSAELTRRAEGEAHESIAHEALQQEVI